MEAGVEKGIRLEAEAKAEGRGQRRNVIAVTLVEKEGKGGVGAAGKKVHAGGVTVARARSKREAVTDRDTEKGTETETIIGTKRTREIRKADMLVNEEVTGRAGNRSEKLSTGT